MPIKLTELSRAFGELETQRLELLAGLEQWPLSRLNFRPASDAWSAVEVLDHIVRSETGMTAGVRAGLRNPHALRPEDRSRIAGLEHALRSDHSFSVPAGAVSTYPDALATFAEVIIRWLTARSDLKSLLGELTPADTLSGVFRHPYAGWMTVSEVLRNFSAHLYHHCFQIDLYQGEG